MPARPISRNNLIAGLFVVAGMALAVGVSILISGAQDRLIPKTPYLVRFSLVDGAAGLKGGSPVMLGGQPVGRVSDVQIIRDATLGGAPVAVEVGVLIRADLALYEDAAVFLERPLLGSFSNINIASAGDGTGPLLAPRQGPSARLEGGERLIGMVAPPSFLAQAGYGPQEIASVKKMIAQAAGLVERADAMIVRIDGQIDPILQDVRATTTAAAEATKEIREKILGWTGQVDDVLSSAQEASTRLTPIMDDARAGVADGREMIASVQAAIDENRPAVDRTLEHAEAVAASIREETLPEVQSAIRRAGEGVDRFASAGEQVDTVLRQESPNIQRTLANARLASDQLKLAMVEIRRTPWRLLYSPGNKELESELFYDAARTYAAAVSDLRAASESLEVVTRTGTAGPISRESLENMSRRLGEAFEEYQNAEKRLLERIAKQR